MPVLSQYLRDFLKVPEVKQALDEDNFKYIYDAMKSTRCSPTEFTELMIQMGDNPLDYLTNVPEYFMCRSTLSQFDMPDHIKTIGSKAFVSGNFEAINMPSQLNAINAGAFCGCGKLSTVDFTKCTELGYIGQWSFEYCINLKLVDLSKCMKLTKISESAFAQCNSLDKVLLPESLVEIERYAFENCTSLTEITVPKSVKAIGIGAFAGCEGLNKITLPKKFENEVSLLDELPNDVEIVYH